MRRPLSLLLGLLAAGTALAIGNGNRDRPPTTAQVLEASQPSDWRRPDPENTLYLELPVGRVIDDILLLDHCSTAADWAAGVLYLPLR